MGRNHPNASRTPGSLPMRLEDARLYLVVDARPAVVAAALRGGVDVVQLRLKEARDEEVVAAGRELRRLCAAHGALLIVNDRPDLALACGADGVHVGQEDVSVAEARRVVGEDRIVGLSTHSPEQIAAAGSADYIGVGPVYPTATKPTAKPVTVDYVRWAAANVKIPWFAIGGITLNNLDAVLAAGAQRICVVSAILNSGDIPATCRKFKQHL